MPSYLTEAAVKSSVKSAMRAWNGAAAGRLMLKYIDSVTTVPEGEVLIVCRFSKNPVEFKGTGIDEFANTTSMVDAGKNTAVTWITFNDTAAFTSSSGFSTDGANSAKFDFELVALHELGHAIGISEHLAAAKIPPIMAPAMQNNSDMSSATGSPVPTLRTLFPQDVQALRTVLDAKDARNIVGKYSGELPMTKRPDTSSLPDGYKLAIRKGDLEIREDKGKIVFDYRTSTDRIPAVSLLLDGPITFKKFPAKKALVSAAIKPTGTPDELEVTLELRPMNDIVTFSGVLKKQ